MTGFRCLLRRLFVFCALATAASAQVQVNLQMERKNFVAGEALPVTVTITNQSGQDLNFQGSKGAGWLDLTVISSTSSTPMTPSIEPAFGTMSVPLGQTKGRSFDLRKIYPLTQMGNYSVYATIRLPGQERGGFISNRAAFTLNNAIPYWTQKVGLGRDNAATREFRIMSYNNGDKTMLYAQVIDLKTGSPLQTHSLGEYLSFAKPAVTVDKSQVMHALYMVAPMVWSHARVNSDGILLGGQLHKSAGGGSPMLVTTKEGAVAVANSIPYDPRAEAEARAKVRKASDRPDPAFLFH